MCIVRISRSSRGSLLIAVSISQRSITLPISSSATSSTSSRSMLCFFLKASIAKFRAIWKTHALGFLIEESGGEINSFTNTSCVTSSAISLDCTIRQTIVNTGCLSSLYIRVFGRMLLCRHFAPLKSILSELSRTYLNPPFTYYDDWKCCFFAPQEKYIIFFRTFHLMVKAPHSCDAFWLLFVYSGMRTSPPDIFTLDAETALSMVFASSTPPSNVICTVLPTLMISWST